MVNKKSEILKIICEKCKQETNHCILNEQKKHDETPDGDIWVNESRQIVECKWCWNLSFIHTSLCSEDIFNDENGYYEMKIIDIFPKRSLNTIKEKDFRYTPNTVKKIYKEIIIAYNENCYLLTVIWIRALLEWICKEDKIKWKDLSQKIKSLVDNGIITLKISNVLHDIRKLWNEVTHELETLDWFDVKYMIEIMENIIENIYELPNKSQRVIQNKEIRVRTKKK